MSLFLESIKVKNGQFFNIEYHQKRVDHTLRVKKGKNISIPRELKKVILPLDPKIYKLRFIYGLNSDYEINIEEYKLKNVESLKVVNLHDLDYEFKYLNRKPLEKLYDKKGKCDDILMVRNDLVTDSYYANLAFLDQEDQWVTPRHPLLAGTKRALYLNDETIKESDIDINFIRNYKKVSLFNAMIDLGEITLDIKNVKF